MQTLARTLTWPVISLLITGVLHFTAEAVWPDLKAVFLPATLAPLLLAYGLWAGYRAIGSGGTYGHALAAGVILGILPLALDVVGFGIVLGRGVQAGGLAGVFGFAMILFGSLVGGGFALSGERRPAV